MVVRRALRFMPSRPLLPDNYVLHLARHGSWAKQIHDLVPRTFPVQLPELLEIVPEQ